MNDENYPYTLTDEEMTKLSASVILALVVILGLALVAGILIWLLI